MSVLEFILNLISMFLAELLGNLIPAHFVPIFKKREQKNEELAKKYNYVKMDKKIISIFKIYSVFAIVIAIIIFAFPKFIKNTLGFNYIATIILWWMPLIFNTIILYLMLIEVKYDDEHIIVKKPLLKPKIYKFSEITDFSKTGNLKVKTLKGNFILFKAMAGTQTLREILTSKTNNVL